MNKALTFTGENNTQVTIDKKDIISYVFVLTDPNDQYNHPHFILKTKLGDYKIRYAFQFKELKDYFKKNNIPGNL